MIFVFGSNLNGWHGKGAALYAKQHFGAIQGQGTGHQGNSYAIPTKGYKMEVLCLDRIADEISVFITFTKDNKDLDFLITPVGCGLAGYKRKEIWPLFKGVGENCFFSYTWNV